MSSRSIFDANANKIVAAVDPEWAAEARIDLAVGRAPGEHVNRVRRRIRNLVRMRVEDVVGTERQREVLHEGVAEIGIGGPLGTELLARIVVFVAPPAVVILARVEQPWPAQEVRRQRG